MVAWPPDRSIVTATVCPTDEERENDRLCCCGRMTIATGADIVMSSSLVLIVFNLFMKAIGYSDTDWNWELLFLVVDSVAVACLCAGIRRQHAALLQPFVLLSLITISFLLLLTIFFSTAVLDCHSYAGEYLEMELRENVQSYATLLGVQSKAVVPIIATVLTVATAVTLAVNCWFLQIVVQCARYFRALEDKKTAADLTAPFNSVDSGDETHKVID